MVVSTDTTGSLIPDLRAYLQNAAAHDVFVQICLWNGAVMRNQQTLGLYKDVAKLQSYVQTVLAPMAEQLSNETALIGFEIINEPEGSVALGMDDEPCFDTSALQGTGAGWNGHLWTMRELLTFVSVQVSCLFVVTLVRICIHSVFIHFANALPLSHFRLPPSTKWRHSCSSQWGAVPKKLPPTTSGISITTRMSA